MILTFKKYFYQYSSSLGFFKRGDLEKIEVKEIHFCCEKLKKAFGGIFVGFGEVDSCLNKNEDINIYHCDAYPEGACWESMPIKFCPFCATELKVKEL